jgi:hypothetical protein
MHKIATWQTLDLYIPAANLTVYQKGIYYQGIKIYNHLPKSVKDLSDDKNKFKFPLKRYLLHNSFYSLKDYFDTQLVLILHSISLLLRLILIIVLIITSKIRQWHYTKAQFILFILNVRTLACYYAICIHDYFHIRIRLMECEINEMKSKL